MSFTPLIMSATKPLQTLLIVDDEEGPRQSLRIIFKDDYEVLVAENGPRALELARTHPVDAAVLDLRMPGMSGIEVIASLKEQHPTVQTIVLTGYETVETARQALRLGATDYLSKPCDITTIRAAVRDAMARHVLAAELSQSRRQLASLQGELQEQRLAAETQRERGDIFAGVVHDLNSPLTVICGLVEMLSVSLEKADHIEGTALLEVKTDLAEITRQVARCVEISHRYLGFLRQHPVENARADVRTTLRDLADLLRVHPMTQSNQLEVHPPEENLPVAVNGVDLLQMLLNLALNGLQCSSRPHRVEVHAGRLSAPPNPLELAREAGCRFIAAENFNQRAPLVGISIQDDGPGIPPELLPRIFADSFSTKPAGQGTGLGLLIVRRLVTRAGGAIHLKSQAGIGTVITLYLPAAVK